MHETASSESGFPSVEQAAGQQRSAEQAIDKRRDLRQLDHRSSADFAEAEAFCTACPCVGSAALPAK
jgi:hypothetical protein